MASYSTNEFRSGLKIMLDGDPYVIVENEFVKPGKGQAFNRVRIRNLKTGRTLERNMKSGDTVPKADVSTESMQYMYASGDMYHFMNSETFEQIGLSNEVLGDAVRFKQRLKTEPAALAVLSAALGRWASGTR